MPGSPSARDERAALEATSPYRYAEAARDRFVEEWRACCRIPSVSATRDPSLRTMADWLTGRLDEVLDVVEQIPVPDHGPVVLGELRGEGPSRLLLYSHYDVQPAEPVEAWTVAPFAAEVRRGRVVARGVCDDKADVMARLHALEAWRATRGSLPFSVVWLSEGAEEIGSPGLRAVLESQSERLRSDACLWESYLRRADGAPEVGFGCRGIVCVELSLQVLEVDQHSAFATVFRSAPAELVRALASLTDADGRVTIDGFHDTIAPSGDAERAALSDVEPPDPTHAARDGSSPFLPGLAERELARRLLFEPTANISGLTAGYTGDGAKTTLPASAAARVDFRLVPDQRPETVLRQLRDHLDQHGFQEVEIRSLHMIPPARSPLEGPLPAAVLEASEERFGRPVRYPVVPGSGPLHIFADVLAVPTVMPPGSVRIDSGIHGPDEQGRIDDYLDQVGFTIRVLELLAERGGVA